MDLAKECQLVSLATSFAQGGKSKNSNTGWTILRLDRLKQSIHIRKKKKEGYPQLARGGWMDLARMCPWQPGLLGAAEIQAAAKDSLDGLARSPHGIQHCPAASLEQSHLAIWLLPIYNAK